MYGLIIAGGSLVMFGGLYAAGVLEARIEMRRRGEPAPLPMARIRRR